MIIQVSEIKEGLSAFLKDKYLQNTNGQILVSYAHKINGLDVKLLINSLIKEIHKIFYFNRPEEDLELLAYGELFSIKINSDNRFSLLREKISAISAGTVNNFNKYTPRDFPLFFGGTKFCPGGNSEEWKDFDDNDWFIPNILFYKKNGEQYIIINLLINDIITIEQIINGLLEQLDTFNKIQFSSGSVEQSASITINKVSDEFNQWNLLVNDALVKIKEGLFRKVVLSRRLIADITGDPIFPVILQRLRINYSNCNIFLYHSGNSILFGATPEQLLKFRSSEVEFDALAGSAPRGVTSEDDNRIADNLLMDKKNGNEHIHVIEFIRDITSRYVHNFQQSKTGIKKFLNIQHIYTPIKGILKSNDQIYNLVEDIFPTPAICGSPKDISLKYISENEKFDRGMFSGIVGFMNRYEMDLLVAIRSALVKQGRLFIYAGCGIVDGSEPQSEFEETEIKMKPILSLFRNENK